MINKAKKTYRERLFDLAQEQHGFITTDDARSLKIPPIELRKLAHRGKMVNVKRGVYQFQELSGSMNESFLFATLNVGKDAYLVADAVLAFHDLAQVNPRAIRVGTKQRIRHPLPQNVIVADHGVPENQIEVRDGIRVTRVARAIIDSKGLVMKERLLDALTNAIDRGLVTSLETREVQMALK